jgi:hypothetical protein
MGAGRSVRKRDNGFDSDIGALTRLRTALTIDRKLDKNLVAKAIVPLDELMSQLSVLSDYVKERAQARNIAATTLKRKAS